MKGDCGLGNSDCGLAGGAKRTPAAQDLECLRPHEVAAKLKISREHVLRLLRAKKLPGFKMGRVWLIQKCELEEYLRRLAEAV